LQKKLKFAKLLRYRTLVDERNEKIGKKIRDNELKRIPYLLIVGEKEAETETISVRKQGEGDKGSMTIDDFAKMIQSDINETLKEI
jgi:threonyl-tRNA synthetase